MDRELSSFSSSESFSSLSSSTLGSEVVFSFGSAIWMETVISLSLGSKRFSVAFPIAIGHSACSTEC